MVDKPNANDPLPAEAHSLPWDSIDPDNTLGKYVSNPTDQPSEEPAVHSVAADAPVVVAANQHLFEFEEPYTIVSALSPSLDPPMETSASPVEPAGPGGKSDEIAASVENPLGVFHEPPPEQIDPRVETEVAIAEPIVQTTVLARSPNRPLVMADISQAPEPPKVSRRIFQNRFAFAKDRPVQSAKVESPVPAQKISRPIADASAQTPSDINPKVLNDGGGWTITLLCVGLALIAACIIIPQADANRRLAYQGKQLSLDLGQIQKQVAVNKDFLQKIQSDPQLAERLAQRQMKLIRQGETVLDIQPIPENAFDQLNAGNPHSQDAHRMSPFSITTVPPAPPLPEYEPAGGQFADLCRNPQSRLYILGSALFMVAAGLVLGGAAKIPNPN